MIRPLRHGYYVALLTLSAASTNAVAQRGALAMGGGMPSGNPVTPLIDWRRDLNLSSRQLVVLDSLERTLIQRNDRVMQGMRAARGRGAAPDSATRGPGRRGMAGPGRGMMDSMRPLMQEIRRNDSVARVAAFAVLDTGQRVRARDLMEFRGPGAMGRGRMGAAARGGWRMRAMRRRWAFGQRGFGGRGGWGGRGFGPGRGRRGGGDPSDSTDSRRPLRQRGGNRGG